MKLNRFSILLTIAALVIFSGTSSAQLSKVVALVKGNVTTPSGSPVSDVSITFYKGSERVNTTKSTSEGKFTQITQPGTQYRVTCSGGNYYYHEETLSVPASDVYQTVPMSVTMRELEIGRPYSFPNLIFEPKSADISSSVMPDLEAIALAMKHNAKLTVSVTVYPDEAASGKKAAVQNSLADSRKAALLSFFLSKNIPQANVTIEISQNVPTNGSFERTVTTDPPATKGKKKKKAPAATASAKKVMVPQYAELVMQMAS
jgi:hypothetical protein